MAPLRFVVIALSAMLLMAFTFERPFEARTLKVLAFPGALSPKVLGDFQAFTGAKVEVRHYQNTLELLTDQGGMTSQGFDVLLGAESLILPLAFRGHLRPLEPGALPNEIHVKASSLLGAAWGYARPYGAGITGIAYRRDLLPLPPRSWSAALDPEAPWAGRVLLLNERRQALGVALKALGSSANEDTPYMVTQAGRWMEERLDALRGLDSGTSLTRLASGDAWLAQAYSGEVKALKDRRIAFYIPVEGGLLYSDVAALGAESPDPELGEAFVNYLLHPMVARRSASGRGIPNRRAQSEALHPVGGATLAFDVAWARIQREMERL